MGNRCPIGDASQVRSMLVKLLSRVPAERENSFYAGLFQKVGASSPFLHLFRLSFGFWVTGLLRAASQNPGVRFRFPET
jgi:hypothetical protein